MVINWIALGGALVATSMGQVLYKLYFHNKKYLTLALAVFFFILAPMCSYVALKRIEIGTVYMSTALTQLLILIMSKYVLDEDLTRNHIVAMAFIMIGVVVYAF